TYRERVPRSGGVPLARQRRAFLGSAHVSGNPQERRLPRRPREPGNLTRSPGCIGGQQNSGKTLVLSPPEANEYVILSRRRAEAKNLSASLPKRDSSSLHSSE